MKKLPANPFLLFSPFLVLYILLIVAGHKDLMEGDEGRYYMYAQNLLHGFYSPKEEVFLWNGPGYPLLLMPFVGLNLPLVVPVVFNALFQYISLVFLFKTLLLFTGKKIAFVASLFWAFYYVAFKEMTGLLTEPLTNMLICLFVYYVSIAFLLSKVRALIISGILLGYLMLTKVVFGYVVLGLLIILLGVFLFRRTPAVGKSVSVIIIAFVVCLPYLLYTWHLTGRIFYWGNSGGMSLYWASNPVEQEFGDWNDDHFMAYCGYDTTMPCNAELFAKYHQADYDSIYRYTGVARDDAFKRKGMQNIMQFPVKYVKNCIANTGRLFFNLPYSYHYQRFQNLLRIPPGAVVMIMLLFSIYSSLIEARRTPFLIWFFQGLLFCFLVVSVMLSATQRQLTTAVPLIVLCAAYYVDKRRLFLETVSPGEIT